jgi:hypothetical protein
MLRPAFVLGGALALLQACTGDGQAARAAAPAPAVRKDPTTEDYVSNALPRGFVTLKDAFGNAHRVEVEIAATHDSRTRGLMWRKELADGKGMLFVFAVDEPHTFWMRNTLIPLDMLFLDRDGKIVGIVQNAEPRTLTARGPADRLSRYVLEVPGGWTARKGIQAGTEVRLEIPPGLDVER